MSKYTNEELCTMIQNGKDEYITELWERVEHVISLLADRYLTNVPEYKKSLRGDMVNEAFTSFMYTVRWFTPDRGCKFTTSLGYVIKNDFNRALWGGHSRRKYMHGLSEMVISINDDSQELSLLNMLTDKESGKCYAYVEEREFWADVGQLLHDCIDAVNDKVGHDIILCMYVNNVTYTKACEILYGAVDYGSALRHYKKGCAEIREYMERPEIKKRAAEIGLDEIMSSWKVNRWKLETPKYYGKMGRILGGFEVKGEI